MMVNTETPDFYIISGIDYRPFIQTEEQEYIFHKIREYIEKPEHQRGGIPGDAKFRNMCRKLLGLPELKFNFTDANQLN